MRFMEYINFGKSGLKVSKICMGTWHLPPLPEKDEYGVYKVNEEEAKKIIKKAIDLGVNFFDTANVYHGTMQGPDYIHTGNAERVLGDAISGYDRESLVISTKVRFRMAPWANGEGLSRKHIMWQIIESLKRLKTNYIDIYIMHRPDPSTPIEETMETFYDLVRQGLVLYIGESYFDPNDISYIVTLSRELHIPIIAMQEPYNLLEREIEKDKIPIARKYGLGIMAYIPLAQGVLSGKYIDFENKTWKSSEMSRASYIPEISNRYFTDENLQVLLSLNELAKAKGISMTQLALAWILKKAETENVTIVPIVGATKEEHIEEAVEAIKINLDDDTFKKIEEISRKAKVNWTIKYDRISRRPW